MVAGDYDLTLRYGPGPTGGFAGRDRAPRPPLMPSVRVRVLEDQTSPVTADLARVVGVIDGAVTLNQAAPGDGLVLCVEMNDRIADFVWCMPLAADRNFYPNELRTGTCWGFLLIFGVMLIFGVRLNY